MNVIQSLQSYTTPTALTSVLSDSQNTDLKNLLSNFNADDVSDSDAEKIVGGIKDLGISSGKALTSALSAAGFDAQEIGQKGGAEGQRPPPPPPGGGQGGPAGEVNSEAISALTLLLESYEGEDLTEDDWTNLFTQLEEDGIDVSKPFVDIKV